MIGTKVTYDRRRNAPLPHAPGHTDDLHLVFTQVQLYYYVMYRSKILTFSYNNVPINCYRDTSSHASSFTLYPAYIDIAIHTGNLVLRH